jgi:hypothetical protein
MTTEVIVDQKYDIIIVDDSPENTILVQNPDITTIITTAEQGPPGPAGASGITKITEATDVDVTNLENGSVLVYSESSEKWVATRLLENQNVESGHY